MTTPLASKTTISSRNKMAAPDTVAGPSRFNNNQHLNNNNPSTNYNRFAPKTAIKPSSTRNEQTAARLAATSSRIALPRSRLSGSTTPETNLTATKPPSKISTALGIRTTHITSAADRLSTQNGTSKAKMGPPPSNVTNSFATSRSSSKLSSISSSFTRQPSLTRAQASARKPPSASAGVTANYIPDTNSIRKGLAKFSNPMECQRQFQALSSEIRQLKEINDNKEKKIDGLQEQLQKTLDTGVGYATVVQYFAKKLKIDSKPDLETECQQLKARVEALMINENEYETKLAAIVTEYKNHLKTEQDLRASLQLEYDETKTRHSSEVERLIATHQSDLENRDSFYREVKGDLDDRIVTLEIDLGTRNKDLSELRKEYEILNNNFNKLEESLTKDKDARVKYFQEKVNQLQKDVDSLNSVLEMRTERIHVLEKESILLNEVQSELATSQDQNKALRQQLESLQAALENKRVQFENLFADHEKISQELKRERKERRRMTMRSEQLEYVLNESCATENDITILENVEASGVET